MRKFNVTVNGVSYEVDVEEVGANEGIKQAAAPTVVAKQAAATMAAPKAAPIATPKKAVVPTGGTKLLAPMPGMILSMKVADGATVKKGDPVVVLEAMKMENDITANADGVIKFVATKGSSVNSGDVLAVIS